MEESHKPTAAQRRFSYTIYVNVGRLCYYNGSQVVVGLMNRTSVDASINTGRILCMRLEKCL